MELLVLNDLHFGFKRQAGVTPASLLALQYYLLTSTRKALEKWHDTLLLNGDTFDGFDVGTLPGFRLQLKKILAYGDVMPQLATGDLGRCIVGCFTS